MNSKEWFFLGFFKVLLKLSCMIYFSALSFYEFVYQTYSDNQLSICEYVIQQNQVS